MARFLAEHTISFNVMDHFIELLPLLCPDLPIALHFKSKQTKKQTKCIVIKNACAPHFHVLNAKLKTTYFSLIIDETQVTKELAIHSLLLLW